MGARVTATDLDEALPLLRRNVRNAVERRNRANEAAGQVTAGGCVGQAVGDVSGTSGVALDVLPVALRGIDLTAERLVWSAEATHANAPFDVVLCSEVVYDESAHDALFECLDSLCAPGTEVRTLSPFQR
jgi:predicted nicotinamide N-methyase